jgi:hypothetical protein
MGEFFRRLMLESRHMKAGVFWEERLDRSESRLSIKESMCAAGVRGGGGVGDLYTELKMNGLFPNLTSIVRDSNELGIKVE